MERADKLRLINNHLKKIKKIRTAHFKKWKRIKAFRGIARGSVNILNALNLSSLVVSLSVFPPIILASLVLGAISAGVTVGLDSYDIETKISSHHSSYAQYTDLQNNIENKITMSSVDLDILLSEINALQGLIIDQEIPVSLTDSI